MHKFTNCLILILMLSATQLLATPSPLSINKDNYFISGKDDAKLQISVKYNVLYPFNIGLYFAYTEVALWNIYDKSAPFREFNHNPEVFWELKEDNNLFGNSDLSIIDYIKFSPYEHKSNGKDGEFSRSMDRTYSEIQLSIGKEINAGVRGKTWYNYKVAKNNKDIEDYLGIYEAELFASIPGNQGKDFPLYKLYFKGGTGKDKSKYWTEGGAILTILTGYIQPRFMINVFHGYGETLIDYNKKITEIRAGIVFLY